MMKLYLIGLPGSGKSFLGKKIAEEANVPFIDLDKVIAEDTGDSINKIFSEKGEEFFRNLEARALRQQSKAPDFVMACGGGTPCFHNNMKFINETGTSVFLNIPLREIVNRLQTSQEIKTRPLLADSDARSLEKRLSDLFEQRMPFYHQATFILDHPVLPDEVLRKITKK